jgi:hypothetical protein
MNLKTEIARLISGENSVIKVEDLNKLNQGITVRERLISKFAEVNIDIAFSGSDHNEKGVIIDLDDIYLDKLNTENHPLKMGRTIIVVKQKHD